MRNNSEFGKILERLNQADWKNPDRLSDKYVEKKAMNIQEEADWIKYEDVHYWYAQIAHILTKEFGASVSMLAQIMPATSRRTWIRSLDAYPTQDFKTFGQVNRKLKEYMGDNDGQN
jgi:hypothetical protein